jgi:MFS family permease
VILSPPVSQAADYWGRKWFTVILTALGCVGSIVISRANSIGMALAGFIITGLSYGAQPLLHAVSSEVLPRKYRSYGQASVNVSASMGAIVGLYVR